MVMTRDSPGHNTPKKTELCKLQLRSCDGKQDHIQEQTEVSGVFPMKMPELHEPCRDQMGFLCGTAWRLRPRLRLPLRRARCHAARQASARPSREQSQTWALCTWTPERPAPLCCGASAGTGGPGGAPHCISPVMERFRARSHRPFKAPKIQTPPSASSLSPRRWEAVASQGPSCWL